MITLETVCPVLNKHNFVGKPWPAGTINIMRGTIYGNPFSHQKGTTAKYLVKTRDEAVDRFRAYAIERIKIDAEFRQKILDTDGHPLMCCCAPRRCHGPVIQELAQMIKNEEL